MPDLFEPIFGVLLGAVLTAAGFLYRRRDERRRPLRAALHVLLVAWWPLRRITMVHLDQFIDVYMGLLAEVWADRTRQPLIPGDVSPEVRSFVKQGLRQLALGAPQPAWVDVQNAISQISPFHPVLAFDLWQIPLDFVLEMTNQSLDAAVHLIDPTDRRVLGQIRDLSADEALQLYLAQLERGILKLSSHCGLWTALSVRRTVRRAQKPNWDQIRLDMRPYIERIVILAQTT